MDEECGNHSLTWIESFKAKLYTATATGLLLALIPLIAVKTATEIQKQKMEKC